jgi:hypothetical protein
LQLSLLLLLCFSRTLLRRRFAQRAVGLLKRRAPYRLALRRLYAASFSFAAAIASRLAFSSAAARSAILAFLSVWRSAAEVHVHLVLGFLLVGPSLSNSAAFATAPAVALDLPRPLHFPTERGACRAAAGLGKMAR